jgi:hypothetical protein
MKIIREHIDLVLTSVRSYSDRGYLLENGDAALLHHGERSKAAGEGHHLAALLHEG